MGSKPHNTFMPHARESLLWVYSMTLETKPPRTSYDLLPATSNAYKGHNSLKVKRERPHRSVAQSPRPSRPGFEKNSTQNKYSPLIDFIFNHRLLLKNAIMLALWNSRAKYLSRSNVFRTCTRGGCTLCPHGLSASRSRGQAS